MLTPTDLEFLQALGLPFDVEQEGGWTLLVVHEWPLPPGYSPRVADIMIRVAPGYPDMPLDMWYFSPDVARADGQPIPNTEVREVFGGREWQRWSRHLDAGQWHAGVDGLESYFARMRADLRQWTSEAAA